MKYFKIYNPKLELIVPIILDAENVCLHINPDYGLEVETKSYILTIALKSPKTERIICLNNLREAKKLVKSIDKFFIENNWNTERFDLILSRKYLTEYAENNKLNAVFGKSIYKNGIKL